MRPRFRKKGVGGAVRYGETSCEFSGSGVATLEVLSLTEWYCVLLPLRWCGSLWLHQSCGESDANFPSVNASVMGWGQLCIPTSSCILFCQNCDFNCDLRRMWRELSCFNTSVRNIFVCFRVRAYKPICFLASGNRENTLWFYSLLFWRWTYFLVLCCQRTHLPNVKSCGYLLKPAASPGAKCQPSDMMVATAVPCCCQVTCE